MLRRGTKWLVAGQVGLGASGCVWEPGGEETEPSVSLAAAAVPAGFKFASSRPVTVTVTVPAELLPAGEVGGLVVADAQGVSLYRGTVRAGDLALQLTVPLAHGGLQATLVAGGQTRAAEFPITGGAAALRFQ